MLDEKVWLTVSAAIHPKHLPLGRAQDSLQVSSVLFYHPHPGLYGPCFVHWGSHIGAGKGNPPQSVSTKLGAQNCPNSHGMLQY